jgi:hypothetical protein
MAHPPRLARLLLDWLVPDNEGLRGDLDEEFAAGRGRAWYWRQVAAAIALEGPLAVRARAVARFESVVTGFITLLLLGFYAVFVVNVTDWLLRFEGVHLLKRIPDVLGFWNGTAVFVTLFVGLLVGKLIHAGHGDHRVASILAFGGTTMLCAVSALQAATLAQAGEAFLPELVQQVTSTAAFVVGLIGGVTAPGRMPEGLRLFTHRTARPLHEVT